MSDAVNLIALAKMAVIVIGIFLVPVITRKFAAELGLPVGQMAMDRAALAGSALGLAGLRLGWAATQGARCAGSAAILSSTGSHLKNYGTHLQKANNPEQNSSGFTSAIGKKAGPHLEKFGNYLEQASVRHEAKKQGVEPPSLTDKVKKTLSADPRVTGPIVQKEQRYQAFAQSRLSPSPTAGPAGLSTTLNPNTSPVSKGPASLLFQQAQPNAAQSVMSPSKESNPKNIPQKSLFSPSVQSPVVRSDFFPMSKPTTSSVVSRVQKVAHRWKTSSRIQRIFESNERKPS